MEGFFSLFEKLPSWEMASSSSGVDFKSQLTHLDHLGLEE